MTAVVILRTSETGPSVVRPIIGVRVGVRGVASAGAHLIVVEGNIHAPMQTILYRPMGAHRVRHPRRVRRQAADVQPLLVRRLVSGGALGFDHRKGFQSRPLLRFRQAVQLIEDVTAARFHAAMALLHAFKEAVRRLGRWMGEETGPEILDGLGQLRLIVFDGQHIVGATRPDSLGNVGLRSHGVDRYRRAFQRQRGK